MMTLLLLRSAIVLIDMGETHSAYLILIKALACANKRRQPTGKIMAALNALRSHHGRRPFFSWQEVA